MRKECNFHRENLIEAISVARLIPGIQSCVSTTSRCGKGNWREPSLSLSFIHSFIHSFFHSFIQCKLISIIYVYHGRASRINRLSCRLACNVFDINSFVLIGDQFNLVANLTTSSCAKDCRSIAAETTILSQRMWSPERGSIKCYLCGLNHVLVATVFSTTFKHSGTRNAEAVNRKIVTVPSI